MGNQTDALIFPMRIWRNQVYATHSFIYSGYFYSAFQVHYYTQRRSRYSTDTVYRSFAPKRHWQLRVKGLPMVPTQRLERDSNSQPSSRKASTLPMRHHAPHSLLKLKSDYIFFSYLSRTLAKSFADLSWSADLSLKTSALMHVLITIFESNNIQLQKLVVHRHALNFVVLNLYP